MHDLLFLQLLYAALVVKLSVDVSLNTTDAALLVLFDLEQGEALLLHDDLVLHLVLMIVLHVNSLPPLLQLGLHSFGLFGFFALAEVNGFLDFLLFVLSLLLQYVVVLAAHLLGLNVELQIDDFLLDLVFVAPLEAGDLVGAFLGLFNFLPGLHLLLLQ